MDLSIYVRTYYVIFLNILFRRKLATSYLFELQLTGHDLGVMMAIYISANIVTDATNDIHVSIKHVQMTNAQPLKSNRYISSTVQVLG